MFFGRGNGGFRGYSVCLRKLECQKVDCVVVNFNVLVFGDLLVDEYRKIIVVEINISFIYMFIKKDDFFFYKQNKIFLKILFFKRK